MANEKLLSEIHLGVSPLSWTNDVLAELGGDISLETCLKDAAEIGYEGVELGRKFPRDGQKLSSILSDYGLRLIGGWHSGFLTERSVEEEWKAAADHCPIIKRLRKPGTRLRRMWIDDRRLALGRTTKQASRALESNASFRPMPINLGNLQPG